VLYPFILDQEDYSDCPRATALLTPEAVERLKRQAKELQTPIFHVSFFADPRQSLGLGFYGRHHYGPFANQVQEAVDLMSSDSSIIRINFFALAGTSLLTEIPTLQQAFEKDRLRNPLSTWHAGRALNVQLGQQLEPEQRPRYKLPARQSLDSFEKLLIVHFYSAVFELDDLATIDYVDTIVRLVTFGKRKERVFFVVLDIAERLSNELRADSNFSLRFDKVGGQDDTDFRGKIVEKTSMANAYQLNGYIRCAMQPHSDFSLRFDKVGGQEDTKFLQSMQRCTLEAGHLHL
jgi:hypothetical protein